MKTWVILGYVAFAAFLFLLLTLGHFGHEVGGMAGVRWIHDPNELFVYFDRSAWWGGGSIPYTSTSLQEYPQLALLLLTVPNMLGAEDAPAYFAGFYLMEFFFLGLFFWIGSRILNVFNRSPWILALWFLPGLLYFSFNRFDLWMVSLVLAAILILWSGRDRSAFLLLGLATMIKWVPLLLVPLFLFHLKKEQRNWIKPLLFFGLALAPFLFWTGLQAGLSGLWFSIGLHLGRGIDGGSILALVSQLLNVNLGSGLGRLLLNLSWILQLFLPALMLIFLLRSVSSHRRSWSEHISCSMESFLLLCSTTLTAFAIFNRFYSPQWWLWSAALLLPLLKQRKEFVLFVMLDLLHYLIFPFAFDRYGPDSLISSLSHGGRLLITIALFSFLFKRLFGDFGLKKTFLRRRELPVSMERDA